MTIKPEPLPDPQKRPRRMSVELQSLITPREEIDAVCDAAQDEITERVGQVIADIDSSDSIVLEPIEDDDSLVQHLEDFRRAAAR